MSTSDRFLTHSVHNQPTPLTDYNAWLTDQALIDAVEWEGGQWAAPVLSAYGELVGGEMMELGRQANGNPPRLQAFDRYGHRIDEVDFHPAYLELMGLATSHGVHNLSWVNPGQPGAHVARAALLYLSTQADAGTCCPLTMTHAAVPALRHAPDLATEWIPKVTASTYDHRSIPATRKSACTIGMGMTEKQGGSDVRSNTTRAHHLHMGEYELVGHKWFFSAPQSDAHLVLAQAEQGLTCFLVPRFLDDGNHNAVRIQRLKDKLGDHSNASSEVEFQGALAHRVGAEGRGVATILEMVALTRLDCMLGSAGLMRQALVQALNHTRQREAFDRLLIRQPLMENVLADLALESEAAVALALRIAHAVDCSGTDPHEAALARIAMPIGKYWICKRCTPFINEAQECLGGLGYVEDTELPRLYRQAPLNSIWEGSANVQCLDVLRAVHRSPESLQALFNELEAGHGLIPALDSEIDNLKKAFSQHKDMEAQSRYLVERTALALQASILLRAGEEQVAEAFCRSRLGGGHGLAFGTLPADISFQPLLERAMPAASAR
ncbi:MAG: isovaleryl-CoA dehydrogenase [Pseudomonadales bacterium]|nr:isovaleryl-CoA dehydrogenase [Pseudomonadales bacterium]